MELAAMSQMFHDKAFLIIGPQSNPSLLGDRTRPMPGPANRIPLWFSAGHYEFITSHIPPWIWETLWAHGTTPPPAPGRQGDMVQETVRTPEAAGPVPQSTPPGAGTAPPATDGQRQNLAVPGPIDPTISEETPCVDREQRPTNPCP